MNRIRLSKDALRCIINTRISCEAIRRLCTQSSARKISQATQESRSSLVLLIVPAATFCLGTWQVRRRRWKLDLIANLEERTRALPVELPEDLSELKNMEYRKVRVKGTFDHTEELMIGPRARVSSEERGSLMTVDSSKYGVNIVTPFILSDRHMTILVNRGWVPRSQVSPATRKEGQIEGEIEITGAVRLTDKRQPFQPKTPPQKGDHFLRRDIELMAERAHTDPVFIDADAGSTVPGGPIGGQTRVTMRNEHLSYIVTWYSLSAITFWMWYKRFGKRLIR